MCSKTLVPLMWSPTQGLSHMSLTHIYPMHEMPQSAPKLPTAIACSSVRRLTSSTTGFHHSQSSSFAITAIYCTIPCYAFS